MQYSHFFSDQVLLKWGLEKGFTVLPRSGNPDHIRENIDLVGWELDEEDMEALDGMADEEGARKYAWDPSQVL